MFDVRVRPSPPHLCPGPSVGLLATLSIQCTALTRRAFHSLLCLGSCPCPLLLLRIHISLGPALPCSLGLIFRTLTASLQSSVHLMFPSLETLHRHHCSVPVILCLILVVKAMDNHERVRRPKQGCARVEAREGSQEWRCEGGTGRY